MIKFGKAVAHPISITPTQNFGYIVTVGCCVTCFKNEDEMLAAIKEYVKKPKEIEKEYEASQCKCISPPMLNHEMPELTSESNF